MSDRFVDHNAELPSEQEVAFVKEKLDKIDVKIPDSVSPQMLMQHINDPAYFRRPSPKVFSLPKRVGLLAACVCLFAVGVFLMRGGNLESVGADNNAMQDSANSNTTASLESAVDSEKPNHCGLPSDEGTDCTEESVSAETGVESDNATTSSSVLSSPPDLSVTFGLVSTKAMLGNYSWSYSVGDGIFHNSIADTAHPLEAKKHIPMLEGSETTLSLTFDLSPDELSVRCWNDSHWGDTSAQSEDAVLQGQVLELREGGYIYEITATWNSSSTDFGTAHYCVYVIVSE